MAKVRWIQGAVKRPGAFTAKANKAGMGVQQYASHILDDDGDVDTRTKRQASLAKTFAGFSHKKKSPFSKVKMGK